MGGGVEGAKSRQEALSVAKDAGKRSKENAERSTIVAYVAWEKLKLRCLAKAETSPLARNRRL